MSYADKYLKSFGIEINNKQIEIVKGTSRYQSYLLYDSFNDLIKEIKLAIFGDRK